jgi:hypothetical protein
LLNISLNVFIAQSHKYLSDWHFTYLYMCKWNSNLENINTTDSSIFFFNLPIRRYRLKLCIYIYIYLYIYLINFNVNYNNLQGGQPEFGICFGHGPSLWYHVKYFIRQRCAAGFNSGVKGLISEHCARAFFRPTNQFCCCASRQAGPSNNTTMYILYSLMCISRAPLQTYGRYCTRLQNVCDGAQLVTLTVHSDYTGSLFYLTTVSCHFLSARLSYYCSTCSRAVLGPGRWQIK